ncbi:MAG: hypothetical protein DRJ56_04025 [Thermoprotei archaeon]|nr:MAG: hypothetical protein DRJ56_04025 [Thermoprotei archaeon]
MLGEYITEEEALARYEALKSWVEEKGHFTVGAGPFYVDKVDPTARIVVVKANREYPDTADRWLIFSEPILPEVSVPPKVEIVAGMPAEIDIEITHKGAPLTPDDMTMVKYLLTVGAVTKTGDCVPLGDGVWAVVLSGEDTLLARGKPFSLTIIAVSKYACIPMSATITGTGIPYEDYINAQLAPLRAETTAAISDVESAVEGISGEVEALRAEVESLRGTIGTLQAVTWVAVIIAIIGIIVGAVALTRKK